MKEGIVKFIIFVIYDLVLLDKIVDRVMVFYVGKVVEIGFIEEIIDFLVYLYIFFFIEFLFKIGVYYKWVKLKGILGMLISFFNLLKGCCFYLRCFYVMEVC